MDGVLHVLHLLCLSGVRHSQLHGEIQRGEAEATGDPFSGTYSKTGSECEYGKLRACAMCKTSLLEPVVPLLANGSDVMHRVPESLSN